MVWILLLVQNARMHMDSDEEWHRLAGAVAYWKSVYGSQIRTFCCELSWASESEGASLVPCFLPAFSCFIAVVTLQ